MFIGFTHCCFLPSYITFKILLITSRSKESTNHRNLPLTTIAYIIRVIKSTNILEIYIYFILY